MWLFSWLFSCIAIQLSGHLPELWGGKLGETRGQNHQHAESMIGRHSVWRYRMGNTWSSRAANRIFPMSLYPMRRPIGGQNLASLEDAFQSQLENLQISGKEDWGEGRKIRISLFYWIKISDNFYFCSWLSPEKARKLENGGWGTVSFQILENIWVCPSLFSPVSGKPEISHLCEMHSQFILEKHDLWVSLSSLPSEKGTRASQALFTCPWWERVLLETGVSQCISDLVP